MQCLMEECHTHALDCSVSLLECKGGMLGSRQRSHLTAPFENVSDLLGQQTSNSIIFLPETKLIISRGAWR